MIRSNVFQWLKLVVSQSTFPIELCEAPSWKTHRELHFFFFGSFRSHLAGGFLVNFFGQMSWIVQKMGHCYWVGEI